MRDIKFRAWDAKEKKWLLGYELDNLGGFSLYGECMLFGEWSNIIGEYIVSSRRRPEDLVVMQYTGLCDKNGREIYEGDVVTFATDELNGQKTFAVEWGRFGFCFSPAGQNVWSFGNYHEKYEVIGNIYENKDLLK